MCSSGDHQNIKSLKGQQDGLERKLSELGDAVQRSNNTIMTGIQAKLASLQSVGGQLDEHQKKIRELEVTGF